LEAIVDPVAAALRNAPTDDEPESEEEKQSVAETREWLARHGGKGIPHDEACADSAWSERGRVDRNGAGEHGGAR
jgi:hypothetical protein